MQSLSVVAPSPLRRRVVPVRRNAVPLRRRAVRLRAHGAVDEEVGRVREQDDEVDQMRLIRTLARRVGFSASSWTPNVIWTDVRHDTIYCYIQCNYT